MVPIFQENLITCIKLWNRASDPQNRITTVEPTMSRNYRIGLPQIGRGSHTFTDRRRRIQSTIILPCANEAPFLHASILVENLESICRQLANVTKALRCVGNATYLMFIQLRNEYGLPPGRFDSHLSLATLPALHFSSIKNNPKYENFETISKPPSFSLSVCVTEVNRI